MLFRTVLFDVDGTLLDTREFVLAAFEHTLSTNGLPVPSRIELAKLVGPPLESLYARLAAPGEADRLTAAHRAFQKEHLDLSVAYEGAADVLRELHGRGLRLAAVTSRSGTTSRRTLELAGLLTRLEAVISAEDAPALKPDPAHLRAALTALGAGEEDVAMVGDTPVDIEAGKALGAFTVAALYGFHGEEVLRAAPDASMTSITELPGLLA